MNIPKLCEGCKEWIEECLHYPHKEIVYALRCDKCGSVEDTCWKAILPDSWSFCCKLQGIICGECYDRWKQVLFDEKNYEELEKRKW